MAGFDLYAYRTAKEWLSGLCWENLFKITSTILRYAHAKRLNVKIAESPGCRACMIGAIVKFKSEHALNCVYNWLQILYIH